MDNIYLDHGSTTPVLPEVVEAMSVCWTEVFGNAASAHGAGRQARRLLESARETVASLLGAEPTEVIFTSGATEANNLALFGLAGLPPGQIVTSPIEHPSVAEPVAELRRRGFTVESLLVGRDGVVPLDGLPNLADTPRLITVMFANNETGALQPIERLVNFWKESYFHGDAVQAVGKTPVDFHRLGVTSLSLSAHKFHGPKGVGALLLRNGSRLRPLLWGGHQQQGRRPGTEPVPLAVGCAKALELATREMEDRRAHVAVLRQRLLSLLRDKASPLVVNGQEEGGLPHTLNVSFPGCDAAALLMKLDLAGIACSTGSACSSGSLLPSPVLQAMGCPSDVLRSAMRFSLSHLNTLEEIDAAAARIATATHEIRAVS